MSQFSGFPQGYARFFQELAANNNREWFEAHRKDYTRLIQEPAQTFVTTFGERLHDISPDFQYDTRTNGGGSMTRINRDVRFSADKSPYNTHIGMVFWEGGRKRMENSGVFVNISAEGAMLYIGWHIFPDVIINVYRDRVASNGEGSKLESILAAVRKAGFEVGGEHYKRVPAGYSADHPRADLLKHNGLYVTSSELPPETVSSSQFIDLCFEQVRATAPLLKWLAKLDQAE